MAAIEDVVEKGDWKLGRRVYMWDKIIYLIYKSHSFSSNIPQYTQNDIICPARCI